MATKKEFSTDKNFLDLLVEVTKVSSKMDGMTVAMETLNVNMKELRDGTKTDIEFLKTDKISRSEAVRIQTDAMTQHQELEDTVKAQAKEIESLKESRIAFRASLKAWLLVGGAVWTILVLIAGVLIETYL